MHLVLILRRRNLLLETSETGLVSQISEVISQTFSIWINNLLIFGLVGVIYAIIMVPIWGQVSLMLVDAILQLHTLIPMNFVGTFLYAYYSIPAGIFEPLLFSTLFGVSLFGMLLKSYFIAVIISYVINKSLDNPVNISSIFKVHIGTILKIFGVLLILEVMLEQFLLQIPIFYMQSLQTSDPLYLLHMTFSFAILIIIAIFVLYLKTRFYVTHAAIVDNKGFLESFGESWNYTNGRIILTFAVFLIVYLIIYLINTVFSTINSTLNILGLSILQIITVPLGYFLIFALSYIPIAVLYMYFKNM